MTDENFDAAVEKIFELECGLVDHPNDPGKLTNMGISQRSYPNEDIRNLTKHRARMLYWRDYWQRFNISKIEDQAIAIKAMDLVVNMGKNGIKVIQRALKACGHNVVVDGINGKQTLMAINSVEPAVLLAAMKAEQAAFYRLLVARNSKYKVFLKGWLRRAYG